MALALYRKYRPRTFAEIIGQDHVTEPLSQALRTGRLHHAYLFSGPRGCGKTSSARILARSLNCVKGPTPEPCGECASCIALAPDGPGSIDVIEIDAASHGGVDDARDLRERAFFAPVSSRYKIYVIDEAHMVSSAGFNALLKLVEEPPDYVKFVFATTEPEKVLGTIKSRTHHYPFRLIPPSVLRPYLETLCASEGVKAEPNVFPLVVRAGGGSVRDSLSILDQLIAGAGEDGVTYARAVALLGVTDVTLIDEICDALAAGDGGAVFSTIDRVAEAGHDPRRFAGDLLARLRDLIVMQQVPDAVSKGLLDGVEDELSRMESQAQRFGPATLSRMADVVHTGLIDMRGTTSPRLVLELIAARMLLPGAEESTGALLQRMERMERRLTSSDGGQIQDVAGASIERPSRVAEPDGTGTGGAAPANAAGPAMAGPAPAAGPVTGGPAPSGAAGASSGRSAARAAAQSAANRSAAGGTAAARPASPPAQAATAPTVAATAPTVAATAPTVAATAPTAASGASAAPTQSDEPSAPARRSEAATQLAKNKPVGALDAADIRRQWDLVLTQVHRANKRVSAFVREAVVREVDGDTLILVFQHQFHAQALSADPKIVIEALAEVFGGTWRIRCELSGPQPSPRPAVQAPTASARTTAMPTGDDGWPIAAPIGRDDEPEDDGRVEDGWPAPARPPADGSVQTQTAPQTPPAAKQQSRAATPQSSAQSPASKPQSPGRAAAAAAAAGAASKATPAVAGRADPSGRSTARTEPPPMPAMGFDDGDEPLDEGEEADAVRQTSQEQAIDLLRQTLGAEKIDDLDRR
jgi:DNA polymerase III subunit gamma/tau